MPRKRNSRKKLQTAKRAKLPKPRTAPPRMGDFSEHHRGLALAVLGAATLGRFTSRPTHKEPESDD